MSCHSNFGIVSSGANRLIIWEILIDIMMRLMYGKVGMLPLYLDNMVQGVCNTTLGMLAGGAMEGLNSVSCFKYLRY